MKTLITLGLLFSLSAMACPQLENNFKSCTSSVSGKGLLHKVKKITQERVDGETIFAITYADTPLTERTEFFIADGRPHTVETNPRLGTKTTRISTANCFEDTLELQVKRELVTPFGRKTLSEETSQITVKKSVLTNHLSYKNPTDSVQTILICE